jgi:methylthioribose-1-phosphate isomerase
MRISARHHWRQVMVVAPASTVDMATPDGAHIHIEERHGDELLSLSGTRTVAEGVSAFNPVFDVDAGRSDRRAGHRKGVIERPDAAKMAAVFGPVSRA